MFKVAILVDWDNIKERVFHNKQLLTPKTPKFSYNKHVTKLPAFFLEFLEDDERPYRLFFYLAEPYRRKEKQPDGKEVDFSVTDQARKSDKFISRLSVLNLVAIRKGRLAFRGWKTSSKSGASKYEPIFVQKKVDMLIGLDIAHLTANKLVDRILIFSYDTDLQPALKVARIGGLQVVLPFLKEMDWQKIPIELKAHSDFIRIRSYEQICQRLLKSSK